MIFLWSKSDLMFIHYLVSHLMPSSNICYCFLFCLTSKVDLTFFIYIIDTSCKEPLSPLTTLTSGILIYFMYRTFLPIFCRFSGFFLLNEKKVSLCMHRPIIDNLTTSWNLFSNGILVFTHLLTQNISLIFLLQ